jgi:hypothetical protein
VSVNELNASLSGLLCEMFGLDSKHIVEMTLTISIEVAPRVNIVRLIKDEFALDACERIKTVAERWKLLTKPDESEAQK